MKNSELRYGGVAMTLHWLIAAGVIANIVLGLTFADMANSDPEKFGLAQTHKSIGLTILVLSVARVLWRLVNPVPPLPAGMSPTLKALARATHFLLYVLILLIPLTGWLLVSSSPLGLPTMFFGWFAWPNLPGFADMTRAAKHVWQHDFGAAHVFLAWSAIVLVPIHIAGALYHQFLRGDAVFKRMLPGTRVEENA
ncbi:MAG TPA: cytochrome b [Rhizomicrobium sp.]|nr:cytochrome b [Rhizomicrobium sp.]